MTKYKCCLFKYNIPLGSLKLQIIKSSYIPFIIMPAYLITMVSLYILHNFLLIVNAFDLI